MDFAEFAVDPRAPEWAEFRDHFPRCAECSREVARVTALVTALGSEGTGASAHPSDAKLLALAGPPAELARDERARLETHLAGCAPCRTELAAARAFAFAAASAPAERPRWSERMGMAFPLLRRPLLAATLAAVLAVPAGVLVWWLARETPPVQRTPIAEVERSAPAATVAETPPEGEAAPQPTPNPTPEPTQIAAP